MGYKKSIDRPLKPIISRLNQEGLTTLYSCSGHEYPDRAYITFKSLLTKPQRTKVEDILDELNVSSTGYTWRKQYKSRWPFGAQNITVVYFTLSS